MFLDKQWHLVSYDICDKKRWYQAHKIVSKKAMPLQLSVFLFRGGQNELHSLLAELKEIIDEDSDDLRIYPVQHPAKMWMSLGMTIDNPAIEFNSLQQSKSMKNTLKDWWENWRTPGEKVA